MTHYVLIAIITTLTYHGVADVSVVADFNSEANCKAAMQQIIDTANHGNNEVISIQCAPK